MRGLLSRLIAVERQDGFGRGLPQKLQLIRCQGGAERRHGMGEPGPDQRDHIHIAFGDQ